MAAKNQTYLPFSYLYSGHLNDIHSKEVGALDNSLPGLPCGGGGLGGGGEGSGVANSAMGRQLNIVTGIRIKQESLQYKP